MSGPPHLACFITNKNIKSTVGLQIIRFCRISPATFSFLVSNIHFCTLFSNARNEISRQGTGSCYSVAMDTLLLGFLANSLNENTCLQYKRDRPVVCLRRLWEEATGCPSVRLRAASGHRDRRLIGRLGLRGSNSLKGCQNTAVIKFRKSYISSTQNHSPVPKSATTGQQCFQFQFRKTNYSINQCIFLFQFLDSWNSLFQFIRPFLWNGDTWTIFREF
jgi:hypothetical protein